ncbi:nucleoside triphosphate pyrophosphohydrolase family protein [Candidatus Darwinibacter acetoxidans]
MTKVTKPLSTCHHFQKNVEENLVRHFSILDIVSKFQETNARVNRALFRAVTDCGCIKIDASKQVLPDDCSFEDIRNHIRSHLEGQLCENCREVLEAEVGQNLFYLAGMCNALKLDLEEIISKENQRVATLGIFHLR